MMQDVFVKLNPGLPLQKHHSTRGFFHQKIGLNARKKRVKCYIGNINLCGAETLTLWKVDQKYLESSEM